MLTLTAMFILLVVFQVLPSSRGSCPDVCTCKWKSGKQTVECLERALITIPKNIDSETQVLDMTANNLQIIPKEIFLKINLTNLQKVYFKKCKIGQIDNRAFRGLTNLIELDLSNNLLTVVPSLAFENTPFLRYLSLSYNPIQKVESNSFEKLTGIVKIDLSNCELQTISSNAFDSLMSLEWLKLNGNKLTELHPKTLNALISLHGIDLHDNPWLCDCNLRPTKEWLIHNNTPHSITPICERPERLSGRTFTEIKTEDFACPPKILPVSRYVEAIVGQNASILCRVEAEPAANIYWYWNGRLLQNNSAVTAFQKVFIFEVGVLEKSSLLLLTGALETDSGIFHCVAENRAGTAEANFTLAVFLKTTDTVFLGKNQIVGLFIAFSILIFSLVALILFLLNRWQLNCFLNNKTSVQVEDTFSVNDNHVHTKSGSGSLTDSKHILRKPQKAGNKAGVHIAGDNGPLATSFSNNPDLILDTNSKALIPSIQKLNAFKTSMHFIPGCEQNFFQERKNFNRDSFLCSLSSVLYNSSFGKGDNFKMQSNLNISDKLTIGRREKVEHQSFSQINYIDYPPDYGLPILIEQKDELLLQAVEHQSWGDNSSGNFLQKYYTRQVPVNNSILTSSKNSHDEGYQEGCATDV